MTLWLTWNFSYMWVFSNDMQLSSLSSCTLLLSAGLLLCQKGSEWTFIQGLWRYTRPYLSHYVLMKRVQRSFHPNDSFIGCFIVFKRCSFEHMNKRQCEHLWEQPNSLAAFLFFYPANDCISFMWAACWRHFLYILATTVSSIICSENGRSRDRQN